jgi:neutral amino acid transport system permease protein
MVDYLVSSIAILTLSYALFSLGLNLQWGYTGLVNFGHIAFSALGAYTTILICKSQIPIPMAILLPLSVLAGIVFAAVLGLIIGLSTLRLREDYLAIVTIGLSEVVRLITLNEEQITNGARGVYNFPLPLSDFNPNLVVRSGMLLILLGMVGIGLWQLWEWMGQQIPAPIRQRSRSIFGFIAYLLCLLGVLYCGWIGFAVKPLYLVGAVLLALLGPLCVAARTAQPKAMLKQPGTLLTIIGTTLILGLVELVVFAGSYKLLYDYDYKTCLMWLLAVTVAIVFWRLQRLVDSPWGRVLKAVREDEEVAKALGKNVFRYKLQSFMIGGAIAGLAGSFFAWNLTYINPDGFIPFFTFQAWIIVVLGGSGNNVGTLLGSVIFWAYDSLTRFILPQLLPLDSAQQDAFRIMVIGLLLMILMMWRPQGILGKKEELTLGR